MPQQAETASAMLSHSLGATQGECVLNWNTPMDPGGTAAGGCWLTILVKDSLLKGERILTK